MFRGGNFSDAVRAALDRLGLLPENDKDLICDLMVSREKLMTTAVGDGMAVPHVRVPVVVNVPAPVFGVFFLRQSIDMNALDGQPVHTLFVLLSMTPKQHLELLASGLFFPPAGVQGEEVHEVAVGPVHAGVIEPGHFRFQCHGEQILHLEIMLGYQRRGVETLLPHQRNPAQQIVLVESIAGDSVIAHATAFCAGIESLAGSTTSLRDHAVRSIAAELERIAMHLSTLSGISIDIGFALPAAAIGNLRTLAINLTAEICGSRFGRGWIILGGVRFDADEAWIEKAKKYWRRFARNSVRSATSPTGDFGTKQFRHSKSAKRPAG
jgi:hypothetical protein